MMKRNAWLFGTAATVFALTVTWADLSEAQRARNGAGASDQARRALIIRNNIRRSRNQQDTLLVVRDAEALIGHELTVAQKRQMLEAVTARNLAIEVAQDQYRQRAQTLVGDADSTQISNAQRQQLRNMAEVRDDAIRSARDELQQNVASILHVTVDQLAARSEELKAQRQLEQQNNGRPLTEDQKVKLRSALAARTEAVETAQSQYRQSARELLPNANGTRLTEAEKQQLRPLAATRDAAIRAAQDAFNRTMGISADASTPPQEAENGNGAAQ